MSKHCKISGKLWSHRDLQWRRSIYSETEALSINEILILHPSSQVWGSWVGGGCKSQRETVRASGGEQKRIFWTQEDWYPFELTAAMPAHTGHGQVQTNSMPSMKKRKWTPSSAPKQETIHNGYWERKKKSLFSNVALHSRAGPMIRHIWPTQNGLYFFVLLLFLIERKNMELAG